MKIGKLRLSWEPGGHWINWGWENGIARISLWWSLGPMTVYWVRWELG